MTRAGRRPAAALLLAALVLSGGCAVAGAQKAVTIEAAPIEAFDPRDPAQTRFGALEFRGGLVLTSGVKMFGGLSGIHVEPDGERFLAITDRGVWLRGRVVYRDGKPAGIADAEMAPMLGPKGRPLSADTEALALRNGRYYVGIERNHRIVRFDVNRHGLASRAKPLPALPDFKTFASNKGLECLAAPGAGMPFAGRLIAVTERSLDDAGNVRAFVLGGRDVIRFAVTRSGDFDITDCAVLPGGDLLLLERHFSLVRGVAMRIRRIPLAAIEEGAVLDGPALIQADLGYQIDNMEGIAVHRNARGETILMLVSDDNFSPIQRTLLLQFALP